MKVDPSLAADIRAFAKSREYGLVFEHNRPEAMRLYGKPVSQGDAVHILAPRGKKEKNENRVAWRVVSVEGDTASLALADDPEKTCEAALDDLVAIAEYDQPIYCGLRETGRVERGDDKPYQMLAGQRFASGLFSFLSGRFARFSGALPGIGYVPLCN